MNRGIANYYASVWQQVLPDLQPALVPLFNQCVALAEGYTVPAFTLRCLWRLMKETLKSPYHVTGYQPATSGQPFWLTVSIEEPAKPDASQEMRKVFHTSEKGCPPLQQLCKWYLQQLI